MTIVGAEKRIGFKKILFLTDFSEPSFEALPFAVTIARAYGAVVHAAHILIPSTGAYMVPEMTRQFLDDQEESAKAEMQKVEARLFGLPSESILQRGAGLWADIAPLVEDRGIDLIVLGTHGRTGFKKALLGSAAEEVFRHARVPVLLAGPAVRTGGHNGGRFRCVLFATDFNALSARAANYAASLAQESQAQLILLHVLPAPKPGKSGAAREVSIVETIHRLEELLPKDVEPWCRPRPLVEHGKAAAQIVSAAKQYGADLIVLGVHGLDTLAGMRTRLQNDIAYEVIANAPCPVLTVRRSDAEEPA